jgi:hypothetical protein
LNGGRLIRVWKKGFTNSRPTISSLVSVVLSAAFSSFRGPLPLASPCALLATCSPWPLPFGKLLSFAIFLHVCWLYGVVCDGKLFNICVLC